MNLNSNLDHIPKENLNQYLNQVLNLQSIWDHLKASGRVWDYQGDSGSI